MKKICLLLTTLSIILSSSPALAFDELEYQGRLDEIGSLLSECAENNISTDYETAAYTVLSQFKNYMISDIENGYPESQIQYNEAFLDELYTDTKAKLESYLDGGVSPSDIPDRSPVQGRKIVGKNIFDEYGKPVISMGFGHFGTANYAEIISDMGMDNIAIEFGPSNVTTSTDICNWKITKSSSGSITRTEDSVLKIVNTLSGANSFEQLVCVEPGKTYTITAKIKTDDARNMVWFNEYTNTKKVTQEYSTYTWEVTTKADEYLYTLRFGVSAVTSGVYFDDITMTASGGENIVLNGDFVRGKGYFFKNEYKYMEESLNKAEAAGLACHVLLSPHYMPVFMKDVYPEAFEIDNTYYNNLGVIVNHPDILEFYKNYFKYAAHIIKIYPALASIIVANEPRYETLSAKAYYNPEFRKWLKEKYNSNLSAVSEAHGILYASFDSIVMPEAFDASRNFTGLDYDWLIFNQDMFTVFFKTAAEAVRSETDIPISIKMENPLILESYQTSIGRGLRYGLNVEKLSPYFDIAGCDNYCVYNWKETRSDTMAWYDMLTSLTGKPVYNSEDHVMPDDGDYFGPEQARYVRYNLWEGAVHGKVISSLWSYSRRSSTHNTPVDSADTYFEAAKTSIQLREYADIISDMIAAKPKVAILYSQASRIYNKRDYAKYTYNAYQKAVSSGSKVGFVTEEDISKVDNYSVLILSGATNVTAETAKGIKSFIENGGTVIRVGNCLTGDEHKLSLDSNVVNYIMENSVQSTNLASELDAALDNDMKLTDSDGKPLTNVDWRYTLTDDKIYINLCNVGDLPVNIKASYKGKEIKSFYSEFTDENIVSVTAEPTVPQLLSINIGDVIDRTLFKIVSADNNSATVKSLCTHEQKATVAAVLRDKGGNIKGIASNTKLYKPGEIKSISYSFGDMAETDTVTVEVWDSFENREKLETE